MNKKHKNFGFTLIELLVVLAIIALLSSVIFVFVSEARKKAEITRFKQEVNNFRTAIELYKNDHNGQAPGVDIIPPGKTMYLLIGSKSDGTNYYGASPGTSEYDTELVVLNQILKYIQKMPVPTSFPSGHLIYYYGGNSLSSTVSWRCGDSYTDVGSKTGNHALLVVQGYPTSYFGDFSTLFTWKLGYGEPDFNYKCLQLD